MCDVLVVGLTTDELAVQQKRKTMLSWPDRKAVLESLWMVDAVVAHDGDSKDTAWEKLNFDVLFIGDDYFGTAEYKSFDRVPIIYLPRTPYVSSRQLLQDQLVHLLTRQSPKYSSSKNLITTVGSVVVKLLGDGADGRQEARFTQKCSPLFLGSSGVQLILKNRQDLPNLEAWLEEHPKQSSEVMSWVDKEKDRHTTMRVCHGALCDHRNILVDSTQSKVYFLDYSKAYDIA
jgi:glycerol-3-phosphate cytidylyltransferase-like family protein